MNDLQRATLGKRIIAAIFDGILLSIVAVGVAVLLSASIGYDSHYNDMMAVVAPYEEQYGIDLQITQSEYEAMTPQEQEAYMEAFNAVDAALQENEEYARLNLLLINMRTLILTFSVLAGVLLIEFFVPLMFGNGQTLGKKIFGIGLMHIEGIRVTGVQMFIRAILGKFTFELMIPLYILLLIFSGGIGIVGPLIIGILLIVEIICVVITRTNALLHDVLASTVAVDFASQRIFEDREELQNHIKAIHAERAARADY